MEKTALSRERTQRRELASICDGVIEKELKRGRLRRPGSMRNLRRWLRREVLKREGLPAPGNRSRLMRAAAIILVSSGMLLFGGPTGLTSAQATPAFDYPSKIPHILFTLPYSTPVAVDIDKDGDLDIFSGTKDGTVAYYENTGSAQSPTLTARTGASNPLDAVDVGDYSAPGFVDIDNDGDQDVFVGEKLGTVKYYENTGSAASPVFTERTGANNPFDGVAANGYSKPVFANIDNDSDMDAFVGEQSGQIRYYENTGTEDAPVFTERIGANNPLDGFDVGTHAVPVFVDMDTDEDLDAISGSATGPLKYYENIGSKTSPVFVERTGYLNPIDDAISNQYSTPAFADMDNDGDMDLFHGWNYGSVYYYESRPLVEENGNFTLQYGSSNFLNGLDAGRTSKPVFVDIDKDGDMDAFSGNYDGNIKYYENIGNSVSPDFTERTGVNNPLDAVQVWGDTGGGYSAPAFADIDDDGDMDFFVGGYYANVDYYENIGNAVSPVFTKRTGVANPLDAFGTGDYNGVPVFADIDDDGDLDLFMGESTGKIHYYENIGNAKIPEFSERTGGLNPFDGIDTGVYATPTFTDFDKDDDLDAFIGGGDTVLYYENTGNKSDPVFLKRTGASNPMNGFDVGVIGWAAPAIVDIDGDGDLDAFVGEYNGTFNFYSSTGNRVPYFDIAPTITGIAEVGETLGLANTATTDPDGDTVTLNYQWKADGVDISGATSATYVLTTDESGKSVTCTVTAEDGKGGTTSETTPGVSVLSNETDTNSSSDGGGGCYIATAAYGSYMEPDVGAKYSLLAMMSLLVGMAGLIGRLFRRNEK